MGGGHHPAGSSDEYSGNRTEIPDGVRARGRSNTYDKGQCDCRSIMARAETLANPKMPSRLKIRPEALRGCYRETTQ